MKIIRFVKVFFYYYLFTITLKNSHILLAKEAGCKGTSSSIQPYYRENLQYVRYVKKIIYEKFENFNQLNIQCDLKKIEKISKLELEFINFIPTKRILIDTVLNLTNNASQKNIFLKFYNIKGFYINKTQIYFDDNLPAAKLSIEYYKTDFIFYLSNKKLIDENECNKLISENLTNLTNDKNTVFANREIETLTFFDEIGYLKNKICPYVFRNMKINTLMFMIEMKDDFFEKNSLKFMSVKTSNKSIYNLENYLNSTILDFELKILIRVKLDETLIDKYVFKKLERLDIQILINYIQEDLFSHFVYLQYLNFNIINMRELFHSSTNKWFYYLNWKGLKSLVIILYDWLSEYDFPNEDICLFKYFPHERNVTAQMSDPYFFNRSCAF